MAHTGINLENVKYNNRSAILRLLNEQGAMSRKDLAEKLGLTPATVTLICTELIAAGILQEKGELQEGRRAGRRKILVGIDYTCRYVLSICIEATATVVSVSDLKGDDRTERTIKTNPQAEPEEFLKAIANESKVLMWEMGIPREKILGVGVSVPGPVDRKRGISQSAYRVWERPVDVVGELQKYLKYPMVVENNVKAFAEAELVYGVGRKRENLMFLKWGPGVGSAMIIQNAVYESHKSKEGELGHVRVVKDGRRCRCGRYGCLETIASVHAIAERVAAGCTPETMPALYELVAGDVSEIRARNIGWWGQVQDAGMWQAMDEVIESVACTLCHSVTFLAPDAVVVYGDMFQLPHVWERFLQVCRQYDPAYNECYIRKSHLNDSIGHIGPLAVVVNELLLAAGGLPEPPKQAED